MGEVERLIRETGQTSFPITGDPSYANFNTNTYPETENWQKTLGAFAMYGTADVVVAGDQVTMTITVHAEDRYNVNPGQADIATGAPDAENGRFAELGWAKEFRAYGDLDARRRGRRDHDRQRRAEPGCAGRGPSGRAGQWLT